jgi:two-component system, LytTR family, response regulator
MLTENGFERVHRSYLINLKFVEAYIKTDGGYLLMKGNHKVSISKNRKDEILKRLYGSKGGK